MAMNRRSFLRLLGVSAAVAAIRPRVAVAGDTPDAPEVLETEWALMASAVVTELPFGLRQAACIFPAPKGEVCRAVIRPSPEADDGLFAAVRGILCGNDPGQVIVRSVRMRGDRHSITIAEMDAGVMLGEMAPVDWPAFTHERPLEIEYMSPEGGDFLLGVAFDCAKLSDSACPVNSTIQPA